MDEILRNGSNSWERKKTLETSLTIITFSFTTHATQLSSLAQPLLINAQARSGDGAVSNTGSGHWTRSYETSTNVFQSKLSFW